MEQYTGLKDVNGKEIYEGDFVHITGEHWIARMPITDDYYSAVFFEGGMFAVKSDEEPGKHIPDGNFGYGTCHQIRPLAELVEEQSMNDMSVEVLGNIHENPELLEDME
ncbi:hypothetical protein IV38_GL000096 [Lactobacillus selangorensis]|uniref:YopX protein domain-containing protein n=2 Tax=Lactobacillus selangorensis TaxID=81857 RepID=A0A0R2FSM2_9LACO|nr:hypothetical protein IV38_GL000096 [Lactobacillus selangorensis]KRN31426.1 hypothetical protein IV40_GL001422 [Lactobacillus selangorensis]